MDDNQRDQTDETAIVTESAGAAPLATRDRASLVVVAGSRIGEVFAVDRRMMVGRGLDADVRIHDVGISRRHARLSIDEGRVLVEDLGSTNGTFVNGVRADGPCVLTDGDKLQFGTSTILRFEYQDETDEAFQRHMFESASRDVLTGAFNKRSFLDRLEGEVGYARRHGAPLSLILFDLDHFKTINDTYGHVAGDRMLRGLASTVAPAVRSEDVFARYGGEEFVILSRSMELAAAVELAERLRKTIEASGFESEGTSIRVTISVGVASLSQVPAATPDALIAAADDALYRAKRGGRNRVEPYQP